MLDWWFGTYTVHREGRFEIFYCLAGVFLFCPTCPVYKPQTLCSLDTWLNPIDLHCQCELNWVPQSLGWYNKISGLSSNCTHRLSCDIARVIMEVRSSWVISGQYHMQDNFKVQFDLAKLLIFKFWYQLGILLTMGWLVQSSCVVFECLSMKGCQFWCASIGKTHKPLID